MFRPMSEAAEHAGRRAAILISKMKVESAIIAMESCGERQIALYYEFVDVPVSKLSVSALVQRSFQCGGIETVGQILVMTDSELIAKCKTISEKHIEQIRRALNRLGCYPCSIEDPDAD